MVDSVVVIPEAAPADIKAAHEAKMIAKVDAAAAAHQPASTEPSPAVRPEWLPEKFKDASEMAKAYAELEKKFSAPKSPSVVAPIAPASPGTPDAASAAEAVAAAGLDFNTLTKEIAADGKLSDASVAALVAKGIPQDIIDSHVAGVKAQTELAVTKAHAAAGGTEAFQAMATWAAASADPKDLQTYNDLVSTGDPHRIESAIRYLSGLHKAAEGTPASRTVAGLGNAPSTGDIYTSRAQMTADMKDQKYKTDPAFRAQVAAKIGRSTIL